MLAVVWQFGYEREGFAIKLGLYGQETESPHLIRVNLIIVNCQS
jgi:hypothetical protein